MLYAQNERIPNGWSGLRACKRDSTRSLFIHVCGHLPMAANRIIKEM